MRHWENAANDDGSVHALGNGKLCVYEQGPDAFQIFGPPYSTSSFTRLAVAPGQGVACDSSREPGTAIWTHQLTQKGVALGTMTDWVDGEQSWFARTFDLKAPLTLTLTLDPDIATQDNIARYASQSVKAALLLNAPYGRYIYNKYPFPTETCAQFVARGAVEVSSGTQKNQWQVRLGPGQGSLCYVGGPRYPQCIEQTEALLAMTMDRSLERTRAYWQAFTKRRHDFASRIPAGAPEREALLRAIDDVATLIKAQQGEDGGVLAGFNYHLGYIRDQYGDFRCLLALGYLPEAKLVLQHYWNIWRHYGRLHNAHGIGVDGVFHVHENDEVEITGYLIIQAFDYFKASGDEAFLREIRPMLEWAWAAQKRNLAGDMLPFNGDETYVAGGILPRTALLDGSAEATMFFITGGDRLLPWLEQNKLWDEKQLTENRAVLERVRASYRKNFFEGDRYITNNPARRKVIDPPRFRHGVCEGLCGAFGWTERNRNGRYVCAQCLATKDVPAAEPETWSLNSVILMPLYVHSPLFGKEEIAKLAAKLLADYRATGKLPSRPDGNSAVGYDYGLLLYTLSELGDPTAAEIFQKMFSVIDPTGAWVEYYVDGNPHGTRCRPWESGINLEAAIKYVETKYAK